MSSHPIYIDYFTDPLCCWCWAFDGVWRQLCWNYGDQVHFRLKMAGLFGDVRSYHDPINDIHNPQQMAPQWLDVSRHTGAPINPDIWRNEPPASSIPACVAAKAAAQLGSDFERFYIRRLREAVMLYSRNIARLDVLIEIAAETQADMAGPEPGDAQQFAELISSPDTRAALKEDLREARDRKISRYPSLLIYSDGPRGMLLTGYRPLLAIVQSFERFAPHLQPDPAGDLRDYIHHHHRVTLSEISDLLGCPSATARQRLEKESLLAALLDPLPTVA
jgi:putative protein-disulfide isomerase